MKANKSRHIGLSALTVALLGVAAAVFVAVGAVSFIAVYGQAMTADTATRAEQATRQTAAALENYLSNMEEKLNRIAAEVTADSLGSARELDVAVRLYTDVEAVMLWRADGSLAVCSAGDRRAACPSTRAPLTRATHASSRCRMSAICMKTTFRGSLR